MWTTKLESGPARRRLRRRQVGRLFLFEDARQLRHATLAGRGDAWSEFGARLVKHAHSRFPEDRDDAYVDEDTEMERVLSRIYSGPDLEKALGRKPRLGLAGDKPYDCPVDPATGLLKQRPALPTLPQPPEEPAPRRREPDSGDTG